jgi:translocation and assembly module TamB
LLDLRGRFKSDISFDAVLNGEVNGKIDLAAQNVEWRPFPSYAEETGRGRNLNLAVNDNRTFLFDDVKIVADLDKGVLNLKPVQVTLGEAAISIQGVVGGPNNDFKLTVAKLPIDELRKFYNPPIALDGKLNAQLSVSKPLNNPDATGTISLVDGTIRNTPINSAELGFGYENGSINFGGAVVVANNPNPLEFKGDIPLPIPFLAIQPKSTEAQLNLKVENEGLALISLFTDQVSWVGGQGNVDINVRASLFPLAASVNGDITLKNAELASRAFPEKPGKTLEKETLTGINGRVTFANDRILVAGLNPNEEFVGQFSKGKIVAKGVLPLLVAFSERDPDVGKGLDVALKNIALTFKGLYQGGVDGDISVKGSAMAPRIGGEVRLSNGRVLLADTLPGADASGDPGAEVGNSATGFQFSDLKITLGNNLRIVKAPIINFVARGNLLVNGGDLNHLKLGAPEGSTIELLSGQVNLFTTQFVLARGYRHRAVFKPELGPDPILDVRLISSVPEVSRSRVATNTMASEVNDGPLFATNLGSLQTVRIQAKVSGVASQLFQNLELTSSPGRTRNEIFGLIGGGFINTLGKGDSSLGIANLAGSAVLTNIQGFIGNALGLSEFRLFPTITTDEDKQSSTLGLAAEVGFDITPAFSASILRVLTAGQGTQFGLRYRINDSYLFRGSTDFAGENRAVLEYETRF